MEMPSRIWRAFFWGQVHADPGRLALKCMYSKPDILQRIAQAAVHSRVVVIVPSIADVIIADCNFLHAIGYFAVDLTDVACWSRN
jgi:hypothetical protein